jgi:hypothetical protein
MIVYPESYKIIKDWWYQYDKPIAEGHIDFDNLLMFFYNNLFYSQESVPDLTISINNFSSLCHNREVCNLPLKNESDFYNKSHTRHKAFHSENKFATH